MLSSSTIQTKCDSSGAWYVWVIGNSPPRRAPGCVYCDKQHVSSSLCPSVSSELSSSHAVYTDRGHQSRSPLTARLGHSKTALRRGWWDSSVGKVLPCKPEDLSLNPRTHVKRPGVLLCVCRAGPGHSRVLAAHWPMGLA